MTDTLLAASANANGFTPATAPDGIFSLSIRLLVGYEQIVDFRLCGVAVLGLDERPPVGNGWGPSPAHLLGSALGACLGSSLLRSLREHGAEVADLRTTVSGTLRRDDDGRQRIERIVVRLAPVIAAERIDPSITPETVIANSVIAQSVGPTIDIQLSIAPELRPRARVVTEDVSLRGSPCAEPAMARRVAVGPRAERPARTPEARVSGEH